MKAMRLKVPNSSGWNQPVQQSLRNAQDTPLIARSANRSLDLVLEVVAFILSYLGTTLIYFSLYRDGEFLDTPFNN